MLRTLALVGLVAAPFLAIAPQQQSGAAVIIGPGVQPCNALQQEPVVMYDISGYTLTGVYHLHLMVYDNGATSISRVSGGTPIFPMSNAADFTYVTKQRVKQLAKDLAQAGAFQLCDEDALVADLPMTTVTVFRGTMDAKAHTFNYWLPQTAGSAKVQQLIDDFRTETFPNF
ncbi:MAG: hypothetical protein R3F34_02115 [Planctomycetota bacterium]